MWFFLLNGFRKRPGLFKVLVVFLSLVILGLGFLAWYVTDNIILYTVVKNQSQKMFEGYEKEVSGDADNSSVIKKYPVKDGDKVESGKRGNGVNLLLINNLTTESYVKEMLELYRDSAEGKITNYKYNLPIEALLGIQTNETGTYSGIPIPKSYIPYDSTNRVIQWKKAWKSIPAEAMTLRMLNENVINGAPVGGGAPYANSNKLSYTINGINPLDGGVVSNGEVPSRDINVFQVNRKSFYNTGGSTWLLPAKISGYKASSTRQSDAYYLPDNLAYLSKEYNDMVVDYELDETDPLFLAGTYSIVHNGGAGIAYQRSPFGVKNGESLLKSYPKPSDTSSEANAIRADYHKHLTGIAEDMLEGVSGLKSPGSPYNNKDLGTLILLEQGYYATPTLYNKLVGRLSEVKKAYLVLHGTSITDADLIKYLKSKKKTVKEVLPNYASNGEFQKVYATDLDFDYNSWGAMWKPTGETSVVYKNKIKGKDPQVFYATNWVTAGHILDSMYGGAKVYASMLAYAGVNIDPTNPSDYMNQFKNEYVPKASSFDKILEKMGIKSYNKEAAEMLAYGYERSGFWYFLGGGALPVSQQNFNRHYGFARSNNETKYFYEDLYNTKDGKKATSSTKDDMLVNFGKILYDCSTLVADAYNNTIGKRLRNSIAGSSYTQLSNTSVLKTVIGGSPQMGDIYVKSGHVYFYIGKNTTGGSVSLSLQETKTENTKAVVRGGTWVLEAAHSATKVGIRFRGSSPESGYTLRRFKALDS